MNQEPEAPLGQTISLYPFLQPPLRPIPFTRYFPSSPVHLDPDKALCQNSYIPVKHPQISRLVSSPHYIRNAAIICRIHVSERRSYIGVPVVFTNLEYLPRYLMILHPYSYGESTIYIYLLLQYMQLTRIMRYLILTSFSLLLEDRGSYT